MKLLDVLNSPWAIIPDKLAEITEIYGRHLRGDKIDLSVIEAQIGKPLANQQRAYEIQYGGVALLPVEGVLSKRMNMFSRISGGASLQLLARDLRAALADPQVQSVVLTIDSPGGTVDGTQEAARAVLSARGGAKPVVAWIDGMAASAAYWIASAADSIHLGATTDIVGSIGVAMQHVDYSQQDAKYGIKRTDIYSGKYKRIASDTAPLTEEGRAYLQAQSDYYYSLFVDAVAQQRGISVEQVLSNMADGRIFIGQQAIDNGLVDQGSTLDALVAELASGSYVPKRSQAAGAAVSVFQVVTIGEPDAGGAGAVPTEDHEPNSNLNGESMDLKTLKEKHPEVAQALIDEGFAAGKADGHSAGVLAGATAERERILAVEAAALPGHGELIAKLKADGTTSGDQAAAAVIAAEKTKRGVTLQALHADAPAPAPATVSTEGDAEARQAEAEQNLPLEDRAKVRFDRDAAVRAEFGTLERYTGWLKHEERRKAA